MRLLAQGLANDTGSGVVRTWVAASRVATRDPDKAARLAPEFPEAVACTWQPVMRDNKVVAVLDERIVQLERDIAATGQELTSAPATRR